MFRLVFILILVPGFVSSARADDMAALDRTIHQLYEVISGDVGEARDWVAFRDLFIPGAVMTVGAPGADGSGLVRTMTPEDYISSNGPLLVEIGFIEQETQRAVYRYGQMATVLTAYEAWRMDRNEVFLTGVNTVVLMLVEGEWKIASIAWRNGPSLPIEEAFIDRAQ